MTVSTIDIDWMFHGTPTQSFQVKTAQSKNNNSNLHTVSTNKL